MTINIKRGPNYVPSTSRVITKGTGGGILTRTAPPSVITPDQMAGLRAWYKMDALGLSNGDPVTTIVDSSGNGFDLGLTYGSATYTASDLANFNGHPSINGQFSFYRNLTPGDLPSGNQPFAMYVVVHKPTTSGVFGHYLSYNGFAFGWGDNNIRGATSFVYAEYVAGGTPDPGGFYVDLVAAGTGGAATSPLGVTYILAYSYNGGSANLYPMYVNDFMNSSIGDDATTLGISANGDIRLGGKPTYGWSWVGSIAEAIAFADYHDATKMNQVRNYLNNKYQAY